MSEGSNVRRFWCLPYFREGYHYHFVMELTDPCKLYEMMGRSCKISLRTSCSVKCQFFHEILILCEKRHEGKRKEERKGRTTGIPLKTEL